MNTLEDEERGPCEPSNKAFLDSVFTLVLFLLLLFSYKRYFYTIFITFIIFTEEAKGSTCSNAEKGISWLHVIIDLSIQPLSFWDWVLRIYNKHIQPIWQVPHIHARVDGDVNEQ